MTEYKKGSFLKQAHILEDSLSRGFLKRQNDQIISIVIIIIKQNSEILQSLDEHDTVSVTWWQIKI